MGGTKVLRTAAVRHTAGTLQVQYSYSTCILYLYPVRTEYGRRVTDVLSKAYCTCIIQVLYLYSTSSLHSNYRRYRMEFNGVRCLDGVVTKSVQVQVQEVV